MEINFKYVECIDCGWVHAGINMEQCQMLADKHNIWLLTVAEDMVDELGGKSTVERDFSRCFNCKARSELGQFILTDRVVVGTSIQPILYIPEF